MYLVPAYDMGAVSNGRFGERYYFRNGMYPELWLLESDVGACN